MTPWIISRDTVQLIDYMKRAFGAEELACLAGKDGAIEHAEVRIGDSVVMMFDRNRLDGHLTASWDVECPHAVVTLTPV